MQQFNGFVKLHRKLVLWGWYTNYVVKDVFLHCLLSASFKDFEWQGQTIKAGQFITGRKQLAQDLGFTEQQIRSALKKLESTQELTIKTTNKYSVITVNNWEEYQSLEDEATNTLTNNQPTNNQQITTYEEYKENKNNIKERKIIKKKETFDDILNERVEDEGLRKLFVEFIKHRKLLKAPMTDRALKLLINKVFELEPTNLERQKKLLENAIMNGWKSVYAIKDDGYGLMTPNKANSDKVMAELKAMYEN